MSILYDKVPLRYVVTAVYRHYASCIQHNHVPPCTVCHRRDTHRDHVNTPPLSGDHGVPTVCLDSCLHGSLNPSGHWCLFVLVSCLYIVFLSGYVRWPVTSPSCSMYYGTQSSLMMTDSVHNVCRQLSVVTGTHGHSQQHRPTRVTLQQAASPVNSQSHQDDHQCR